MIITGTEAKKGRVDKNANEDEQENRLKNTCQRQLPLNIYNLDLVVRFRRCHVKRHCARSDLRVKFAYLELRSARETHCPRCVSGDCTVTLPEWVSNDPRAKSHSCANHTERGRRHRVSRSVNGLVECRLSRGRPRRTPGTGTLY